MNKQPHAGLSLVNKAPLGLLIMALVAIVASLTFEQLNVLTLLYALIGGIVCSALLIAYWLGKGGMFFVIGVSIPLLLVLLTPLQTLAALFYLISGFFFGFCLILLGYKYLANYFTNK